ncbi:MAG: hypothetical protein J6X02_00025 [Bacilli bacterium]|nr:hypothetical protein [Bacilli bacterium]
MNVEVNFDSVENVLTTLGTIRTNIETCYSEPVSITSYEGSKKEEMESFINKCLLTTSGNILPIIDSIINDIKRINGMYVEANIDNSKLVNNKNI